MLRAQGVDLEAEKGREGEEEREEVQLVCPVTLRRPRNLMRESIRRVVKWVQVEGGEGGGGGGGRGGMAWMPSIGGLLGRRRTSRRR